MTDAVDYADAFRSYLRDHPVDPGKLALFTSTAKYAAGCAVPLLRKHGPNYSVRGTGTLFRAGGLSFLITAAHVVIEDNEDVWRELFVPTRSREAIYPLAGARALVAGVGPPYEPDIAIVQLDDDMVRGLERDGGHTFLGTSDLVGLGTRALDQAYVCGYPGEYFAPAPTMKHLRPLLILTTKSDTTPNTSFEIKPGVHVLLQRGDLGWAVDSELTPVPLPHLGGISGCPVFIPGLSPEQHERGLRDGQAEPIWRPDALLKLAAIEIGVFTGSGLIRTTTWSVVASLMVHRWPELTAEFEGAQVWRLDESS